MGMLGTLAKVAIGYAAARGVDALARGGGMPGLLGGAKIDPAQARAAQAPGLDQMQAMMGQMGAAGGLGQMQDMVSKFAAQSGLDLSALMGGAGAGASATPGNAGLLSSMKGAEGGAGLAGMMAMMGTAAAAAGGKTMGGLLDQFSAAAPPDAEASARVMLIAIIQAAKADGEIDADEQARILDMLGDDADAEDRAFVQTQLDAPVSVEAIAQETPKGQEMQVYSMSLMSIRVDTAAEAQYLDQLAQALGLNQQTVNALHVQMGVQPLYG